MPRHLLISNCAEVRCLFEGGIYKARGEISTLVAVRQNDLPPCNHFFFCPLSAISALSFPHSLTRFSSTPNLLAAPLLLLVRVRVYVEPRPQSTNNYYCCCVYMRAAFITLMDDIRAAFIRGRHLFEGGVYIRKYGICF